MNANTSDLTGRAKAYKVRSTQKTRTLTSGAKYVHTYYTLMYQTPDTVWHEYPNVFSDKAQASRMGREMCRPQEQK